MRITIYFGALLLLTGIMTEIYRPTNNDLDTSFINAGHDTLMILVPMNGQLYIGGQLHLSTKVENNNVIRVEKAFTHDGHLISVDSFSVNKETLAPTYQYTTDPAGGNSENIFKRDAFYSNSMDLLLGSIPMHEGYSAEYALITEVTKQESIATLKVVGLGAIQTTLGEDCPAWEITVNSADNNGTYWISEKDHLLVRYETVDGSLIIARKQGCHITT